MSGGYHHGDLPNSLRAAAVELLAERGPAAFSLREVARRAGVSHAAPAHHFGDTRGLLTSVATEGYITLSEKMIKGLAGLTVPRDRLVACGETYVRFALNNPGHYALMVNGDYLDMFCPELQASQIKAFSVLRGVVEELCAQFNADLDIDSTATLIWYSAHGLVALTGVPATPASSSDPSREGQEARALRLINRYTNLLFEGIRPR